MYFSLEKNYYINVCSRQKERKQIIYLTGKKQNDPTQSYLYISTPTNLHTSHYHRKY